MSKKNLSKFPYTRKDQEHGHQYPTTTNKKSCNDIGVVSLGNNPITVLCNEPEYDEYEIRITSVPGPKGDQGPPGRDGLSALFDGTISEDLRPRNSLINIGNANEPFNKLYVKEVYLNESTLYIGDVSLSAVGGVLRLPTNTLIGGVNVESLENSVRDISGTFGTLKNDVENAILEAGGSLPNNGVNLTSLQNVVYGDISGNLYSLKSLVYGDISGNLNNLKNVVYRDISGNLYSLKSLVYGDISGNLYSLKRVVYGDISGNLYSLKSVVYGDISGNLNSLKSVVYGDISGNLNSLKSVVYGDISRNLAVLQNLLPTTLYYSDVSGVNTGNGVKDLSFNGKISFINQTFFKTRPKWMNDGSEQSVVDDNTLITKKYVDDKFASINGTTGGVSIGADNYTLVTTTSDLSGNLSILSSTVQDISGNLSILSSIIRDVSGNLIILNGSVKDISGNLSILNSSVREVSGNLTMLKYTVQDVSGNLTILKDTVQDVSGNLSILKSTVQDVSGNLSILKSTVQDISGNLNSLKNLIYGDISGNLAVLKNLLPTTLYYSDVSGVNTGNGVKDLSFNGKISFTDQTFFKTLPKWINDGTTTIYDDNSLITKKYADDKYATSGGVELSPDTYGLVTTTRDISGNLSILKSSVQDISGNIAILSGNLIILNSTVQDISGNLASLKNLVYGDISGNLASLKNLVYGDISGNLASLKNLVYDDISGNLASLKKVVFEEISGNLASLNKVVYDDISGNLASLKKVVIEDISGNLASLKDLVYGDISGNLASLKKVVYDDISGNLAILKDLVYGDISGNLASLKKVVFEDISGNLASLKNLQPNLLSFSNINGIQTGNGVIDLSFGGNIRFSSETNFRTLPKLIYNSSNTSSTIIDGNVLIPKWYADTIYAFKIQGENNVPFVPQDYTLVSITNGISENLTTLTGTVNDVSGNLTNLRSSVNIISGNLTTLTGTVSDVSANLTTLRSSVNVISGNLTTLTGTVSDVSGNLTTLRSSVNIISGNLTTLTGTVSDVSGNLTTLRSSVNIISGNLTTLTGTVSDVSSNVTTLRSSVNIISGNLTTLTGTVSDVSANLTTLTGNLYSLKNVVYGDISGNLYGIISAGKMSIQSNALQFSGNISFNGNVDIKIRNSRDLVSNISSLSADISLKTFTNVIYSDISIAGPYHYRFTDVPDVSFTCNTMSIFTKATSTNLTTCYGNLLTINGQSYGIFTVDGDSPAVYMTDNSINDVIMQQFSVLPAATSNSRTAISTLTKFRGI